MKRMLGKICGGATTVLLAGALVACPVLALASEGSSQLEPKSSGDYGVADEYYAALEGVTVPESKVEIVDIDFLDIRGSAYGYNGKVHTPVVVAFDATGK